MKPSFSADAIVENTLSREGFCCFDTADGCSVITWSNHPPHTSIDGWEAFVRENTKDYSELSSPYSGGVVGWLGYEAGRSVETMPPPLGPRPSHDVCLWRTDGAIVLQHESGHVEVFGSQAFREDAATVLARSSAGPEAPPCAGNRLNPHRRNPQPAKDNSTSTVSDPSFGILRLVMCTRPTSLGSKPKFPSHVRRKRGFVYAEKTQPAAVAIFGRAGSKLSPTPPNFS